MSEATARTIRFPARLRSCIAADAERCGRSFEAQVPAILRRHYGESVDIAATPSLIVALAEASLAGMSEPDRALDGSKPNDFECGGSVSRLKGIGFGVAQPLSLECSPVPTPALGISARPPCVSFFRSRISSSRSLEMRPSSRSTWRIGLFSARARLAILAAAS